MSVSIDQRPITPRLATHYAIFVSAFGCLVLLLLILEQLGARKLWLSHVIMTAPVLLYLGIAVATRTIEEGEFFAAGRRVPAVFGGLALAITGFGGVGLFALTGALYLVGFDALGIAIGWGAGLMVALVVLVPFMRKSGAYTVPGFLRLRFGDARLGAVGSLLLLPPAVLLLAAELKLCAFLASLFAAVSYETALAAGAVTIVALAAPGGLRSVTWVQCTQYTVALAGYVVPLVVVSVLVTNLPVPQLTYGALFERLAFQELAVGTSSSGPAGLTAALASGQLQASVTGFASTFTAVEASDFLLLTLCFLAGAATMPALLMRSGAAPSVFEARRTVAWGTLLLAVFLITAPAYAAFAKFMVLSQVAGTAPSQLPDWIGPLRDAGLADFGDKNADGVIGANELLVLRDGVTLALPIMGQFPFILAALVAAAGMAATLGAATAHANAAGASLADDLACGYLNPAASPSRRLLIARLGTAACAAVAALWVAQADIDVLAAAAWAMSLAASAFLTPLALSVWWPRATGWGALAGMVTGFAAAAAHIWIAVLGGDTGLFGLSGLLAGIIGVPASAVALIAVSLLTPPPLEVVDPVLEQLRDPGGPALRDVAGRPAHDVL